MVNHKKVTAKNLVIVISSDNFVRNYITTNAFLELKKEFNCTYLISDSVSHLAQFNSKDKVFCYGYDKEKLQTYYNLFNLMMRRYKDKSKSFRFRIERFDYLFAKKNNESNFIFVLKTLRKFLVRFKNNILSNKFIFPYYFNFINKKIQPNNEIYKKIKEIDPVLILLPTSAHDPECLDLVEISNQLNKPLLFLVDNWDNLSSKSIMTQLPSNIAVWGQQSFEHATQIQGFSKHQISCIGTPRFDNYFALRNKKLKNMFDFKYILFVGTTLEFDEAGAIKKLNSIVSNNPNIFKGVKILYRPHPWRQGRDTIVGMNLEFVIIDPQLIDQYTKKNPTGHFQPPLSYYPSLLQNADIVIGGLSSMLIEALIFKKCFAAIVYNDKKNLTSPHNVLKNYEHFQGLDSIQAVKFLSDYSSFEKDFIMFWNHRNLVDFDEVDVRRRYYCFDDSRKYSERLNDLCCKIINCKINF